MNKKTLELFNVNCDLQPSKAWRELAKHGRKSMNYRIFAHAKDEDGKVIGVSITLGALRDGEIVDLGSPEVPAVSGLLAKYDPRMDTAKLRYGADGRPVTDNGAPVYDEEPIIREDDGTEFDLAFGTLYFCTLHSGLRVTAVGAELTPSLANGTQRFAKDAKGDRTIPIFDAAIDGLKVERRASAGGNGLLGRVKVGVTDGGGNAVAARLAAKAAQDDSLDS